MGRMMQAKQGQVTVFIIVGVVLLFVFIFLFALSSNVTKGNLDQEKESVISQTFQKEAFRLYIEDCLNDELEQGLILLGLQGRLFRGQPGGSIDFVPDVTGTIVIDGEEQTPVFYGITREVYAQDQNAYPCETDANSPVFCEYEFPNTKVGFGDLKLKVSTIEEDLQRYLINRTQFCVENFTLSNISRNARLETEEMDLSLALLNDGISVQVHYPFKVAVGSEEFFHLSEFDFFYPTQFRKFLEAAVLFGLLSDYKYVDFDYSAQTLAAPHFEYGSPIALRDCQQIGSYYLCNQKLYDENYRQLDIVMETQRLANGDEL